MSRLLVCAPLGLEARALRRGMPGGDVRRTGFGARRSASQAVSLKQGDFGMLVVAGTGGGVSSGLAPGDLVVGTEVSGPDGTLACPSAAAGRPARAGREDSHRSPHRARRRPAEARR